MKKYILILIIIVPILLGVLVLFVTPLISYFSFKTTLSSLPVPSDSLVVETKVNIDNLENPSWGETVFRNNKLETKEIVNFYLSELKNDGWMECEHGYNENGFNKWSDIIFSRDGFTVTLDLPDPLEKDKYTLMVEKQSTWSCPTRTKILQLSCAATKTDLWDKENRVRQLVDITMDYNLAAWLDKYNNTKFYQTYGGSVKQVQLIDNKGVDILSDCRSSLRENKIPEEVCREEEFKNLTVGLHKEEKGACSQYEFPPRAQ